MTIDPIGTKIVVQVEEVSNKTASGIIIPDSSKEKPSVGEIKFVNDDTKDEFGVDIGTKVVFGKYAGTELELDGQSYLIVEMDELFGILRD
jgi:chaperonin GroES